MRQTLRVTLEVDGMDELKTLLDTAGQQAKELSETVDRINAVRLGVQAKINQPTAATDG